jgi:exonuclease SbcC
VESGIARSALNKATERAARLGDRLEGLSSSTSDLARALSAVSPFVTDEECPVCHRNFQEVSEGSLQSHLSGHIALLTSAAAELQTVSKERQQARSEIERATEQLEKHAANTLSDVDRNSLMSRAGRLRNATQQLLGAESLVKNGDRCTERVRNATEHLSKMRQDIETIEGIRQSSREFVANLNLTDINLEDSTFSVLQRCKQVVDERLSKISFREENRQKSIRNARELQSLSERKKAAKTSFKKIKSRVETAQAAFKTVDDLRKNLKLLSESAVSVRTEIVQQVFNESLNSIWKDLFVRLAPEEPFVPVFALPDMTSGPVKADLRTSYRGKTDGGNPKAMLSAGNLNTAALTLFLSLHLSAPPTLPWLVLDDPVQNMDDIHIAQFAALLKTLTRQKARQVIIAVHEKPLFDYLALELSPASENDSLITVELSRDASGQTTYDTNLMTWDPKRLFHATG